MKGFVEMNTTKEKVADATTHVRDATSHVRPIVERALRDEELRRNVKDAYTSARTLYEQLITRNDIGHVATKLASDEDVQAQLRNVVEQLRTAAGRAQSAKKEAKKAKRSARASFLLVTGIAIGLLVNPLTGPSLRRFVKRRVFGRKGDGFVYHDGNGTHLS
jgi:hypothetical protein